MRAWMLLLTVAVGLGGCRSSDTAESPRAAHSPPVAAVAPARPGVIPVTPANATIKFTGSTSLTSHDGRFTAFDGTLEMPTPDPKDAAVRVRVDMASTTTNIGLLTKHLKGEDFFDVARHPTAEFASDRIAPTAEPGRYEVTGRFTLHGVQQPVTFPARIALAGDEVAFDATLTLSQTSFGMTEAAKKTKDEVPVTVSIRGRRN